jgi:hypothetical protein
MEDSISVNKVHSSRKEAGDFCVRSSNPVAMRRALLVVAVVVLIAGCAGPLGGGDDQRTLEAGVGEVDNITYDEDIPVTAGDGFNESELNLVVKRSMARIEVIRGQAFNRTVGVELITREEYRSQRSQRDRNESTVAWQNQVWEGLFVVGEHSDVTELFNQTYGTAVQGYYHPGDEQIVIVSDSETPAISMTTLVHELVHALQDQHFGLDENPQTQDTQLARNSVVEGEANMITQRYRSRCSSDWSCLDPPTESGSSDDVHPGLYMVIIQPYQQGPSFVATMKDQDGWESVSDLHEEYPESTEQVIHPDTQLDEQPVNVTIPDSSTEDWSRFDHVPVGDTLGEASLFVMFLHNGLIEVDNRYEYDHPVSEGWGGDKLVPYHNEDDEFGYVWKLQWDTREDAELFYETYVELLDRKGAQERGQRSFAISEGSFEDAFRVTLDGKTVRIVNGPTIDSLSEIHSESGGG